MKDLRCFTLHMFFKIEKIESLDYEDGYVEAKFGYYSDVASLANEKAYNDCVEQKRKEFAEVCDVAIENVIPISYAEYKEQTEDEESEGIL